MAILCADVETQHLDVNMKADIVAVHWLVVIVVIVPS